MKKSILLLISFMIMLSIVGCSSLNVGEEFKSDMLDVFNTINKKHDYFNKGEYDKWLLDNDTQNYIMTKFVKYSFHYQSDSKEKLTKDEAYILESTMDLFNSYVDLQSQYQNHGDSILKDKAFKQLRQEFDTGLKNIKSKIK